MASGGELDPTVRIFDAKTMRLQAVLTGSAIGVEAVAFAPDGKTLVAAKNDIRLWDLSGETIQSTQPSRVDQASWLSGLPAWMARRWLQETERASFASGA